jgi:aminoglycoside/choline kinase family phosphotransferase
MFETGPLDPRSDFFLLMAAFLEKHGFPAPRVLESHGPEGVVVLEDLGSVSLQDHLQGPAGDDRGEWERLYAEAADLIVWLQRSGSAALGPEVPAYHFCLDGVRFGREMDYFREHYVSGLLADPLAVDTAAAEMLEGSLRKLALEAGRPGDRILCHRDFHSRNLMLPPGRDVDAPRLVMIDFQDARLGPRTYDLASLLEDAYLEVPEDLAATIKEQFLAALPRRPATEEFRRDYARVAAQRTLKAVGTFAGQAMRFGNRDYLRYIPRALACARRALADLPDHAGLLELLEGPLRYAPPDATGS